VVLKMNLDKSWLVMIGILFGYLIVEIDWRASATGGWRTWQQWEAGDRRMHPALFELFLIKTENATTSDLYPNETAQTSEP